MSESLPIDEGAEQLLLCCMAMTPQIMDEAEIGDGVFFIPAHKIIFSHLAHCYTEQGHCDWEIFWRSFSLAEVSACGGKGYLSDIYGKTYVSSAWRDYLSMLRRCHIKRTAIMACRSLMNRLQDGTQDSEEAVREIVEKALTAIATKPTQSEIYLSKLIREDHSATKQNGSSGYIEPTNIRALNLAIGWFIPGDQVVIGAETSFGKTTLALNMASHAALKQQKKVAVFSFEMSQSDICKRLTASGATVPLRALRYNETSEADEVKIEQFYQSIPQDQRSIVIEEGYSYDITEVVSRCRRLKATGQLDMVVVDYLQLVNPAITRESNRQREIADISRRLKVMAGELKVVVIALSQLNDDGKLRESRAIGQDADIVLFIEESKSDDAFDKQIRIGKARNGPKNQKINVHFYGDYVSFADKS